MTGPEHYREAEGLLAQCQNREQDVLITGAIAAVAQVHATLALAAATALKGADPAGIAWLEATS